jgi:hypothetical protein
MFYSAVSHRRGGLACRQLAPETRREVVQTEKTPCRTAILHASIPQPGHLLGVQRFGNLAQVRSGNDTAFLAEFPDGWKIFAVGCSPRRPLPYECEVKS